MGAQSLTDTIDITLTVNDINDNAPVFSSDASFVIDEGTTNVTTVTTTDADANSTVAYSLSGADAQSFVIDNSGALTFVTAPDFESGKASYEITVTADDGANTTDQAIAITINDLNDEAPVFASDASFAIDEGTTNVTTVTTTDADANSTVAYSLSGADAQSFVIDNSGALTFVTAPDFELGKTSYEVTVTADDGANTTNQTIVITINDLNDNAPVFTSDDSFDINENTITVTTVATTDLDSNSNVVYSLSGRDASSFVINNSNNSLSFLNTPDFESGKILYELQVVAYDGVNTSVQNIVINIIDTNDNAPEISNNPFVSLFENIVDVTTVTATDADANSNISFKVSSDPLFASGSDFDSFIIDIAGNLRFKNAPDYESGKREYRVFIEVSDGVNSTAQEFVINILDENDNAPVFTSANVITIDENTTAVTTLTTTDADTNPTVTYSIAGGADSAIFNLDNSGVLTHLHQTMNLMKLPMKLPNC